MDKILSIAPSFDCALKCEGCYLTTNVSKEMRVATKNNHYWGLIFVAAVQQGYNKLYMTMNPMPAKTKVVENILRLATMAKEIGFEEVHVTTSYPDSWPDQSEIDDNLYTKWWIKAVDTTTHSIDDLRGSNEEGLRAMIKESNVADALGYPIGFNILWTPTLLVDEHFLTTLNNLIAVREKPRNISLGTIQHLYYKPVSLYPEGADWLLDTLNTLDTIYPHIGFLGGRENIMCDPALLNTFFDGLAECPGHSYQMIDIDPMGFARRCPENEETYDARNPIAAFDYLEKGLPNCEDKDCNCFQASKDYMMPWEYLEGT